MKKIIFTFLAILSVSSLSARDKQKSVVDTIDYVEYRVTYQSKYASDPSKKPFNYTPSEIRLDIGKKITHFYDRTIQIQDSLVDVMNQTQGIDDSKYPQGGYMQWTYYKNYPADNQSTYIENVGWTAFECQDKVENPDWQLIPDSTKTIIGYPCQLAKTNFKGRTWYAWYAEDIPLAEGPWKLCGLPGLILSAYDANQEYTYEGAGISHIKGLEPITYLNTQKERATYKHIQEAIAKYDPWAEIQAFAQSRGMKAEDMVTLTQNGEKLDAKKELSKKMVFNPIER